MVTNQIVRPIFDDPQGPAAVKLNDLISRRNEVKDRQRQINVTIRTLGEAVERTTKALNRAKRDVAAAVELGDQGPTADVAGLEKRLAKIEKEISEAGADRQQALDDAIARLDSEIRQHVIDHRQELHAEKAAASEQVAERLRVKLREAADERRAWHRDAQRSAALVSVDRLFESPRWEEPRLTGLEEIPVPTPAPRAPASTFEVLHWPLPPLPIPFSLMGQGPGAA